MSAEAVSGLLPNLFAGDPAAAQAVFDRYSNQLVRLAEKHLSRRLAGRMDGEDVVQSVFRTFFRRGGEGEFQLDGTAQLWQLLVRITVMKARAKARHHTAGKRDATAEHAISDSYDPAAVAPGPEDAVVLLDQIEALLRDLPPIYGQVLGLRLQGRNVTDVADELKLSRQTIHRALNLLQERLTAMSSVGD
jgi:RNA polymerase sigma-70 factor (ECF subfamily)